MEWCCQFIGHSNGQVIANKAGKQPDKETYMNRIQFMQVSLPHGLTNSAATYL